MVHSQRYQYVEKGWCLDQHGSSSLNAFVNEYLGSIFSRTNLFGKVLGHVIFVGRDFYGLMSFIEKTVSR